MSVHSDGIVLGDSAKSYIETSRPRRFAGVWSLWALGVGAVISGHFSGWNYGLATGGWGGLLVAAAIMAVMYTALVFCIAEMSAALPRAGGSYALVRIAMGPWGGVLSGLCETIEYVMTPAVTCYFIGAYLSAIVGDSTPPWVWWIATYLVFLALNMLSVALSFRFTLIITLTSLAVLLFFCVSALPHVDFGRWALNIAADGSELPTGNGALFPMGIAGILASLPFAVWLYLAIEELPFAAEDSIEPVRDMPKGIVLAMITLVITAFLIAVINPAVTGVGAHKLAASGEPLLDGFRAIFGGINADLLGLMALSGLVASFHAMLYAQGRQIFALSQAGYLPAVLACTHAGSQTPRVAMLTGAGLGLGIMLGLWFGIGGTDAGAVIGSVLLNMAVFGAMLAYILRAIAFIILRRRHPDMPRPYRNPFGISGAVLVIVICVITLIYQVQDPNFQSGAAWVVVGIGVAVALFGLSGQAKLMRRTSPVAAWHDSGDAVTATRLPAPPPNAAGLREPQLDFSSEWLVTICFATLAAALAYSGLGVLAAGVSALSAVLLLVLCAHQFEPMRRRDRQPDHSRRPPR